MKATLIILIISFTSLKAEDTISIKDESYKDWKFGVTAFNSMFQNYTSQNTLDYINLGGGLYTQKHIDSLLNRNLSVIFSLQYINFRVGVSKFEDNPNSIIPNRTIYKEKNHYLLLPVYLSYDLFKTNDSKDIHKLILGGYGGYLINSD